MKLTFLIILLLMLAGCGGDSTIHDSATAPPLPDACSRDEYRPNYCSDLQALYHFTEPTITYRILGDTGATAINTTHLQSQAATAVQAQSIRDGFTKIETALDGRRRIVEVPATDTTACIDVVVQSQDSFGDVGENGVALGRTDLYYPGGPASPVIRRAVVRLMADQPERSFRRTALHESLHAVGLWGHSRHTGDILVPVSLPVIPVIELSAYDRNTLRACYEGR